jgi:hypothetical protein
MGVKRFKRRTAEWHRAKRGRQRDGLRTCHELPSHAWCRECREGFPGDYSTAVSAELAEAQETDQ